ncbi:MAG: hypothetical protein NTW14_08105 [bacterium]|nr:hypothetical protein [bacterium]
MKVKMLSIQLIAVVLLMGEASISCLQAEEIPIEKRVAVLESKVLYLEQQINDLKAQIGNMAERKTSPNNPTHRGIWKNQANWRYELKKGMTKQEVLALMGEPDKVDVYSLIGDKWHYGYPSGGTISFSASGYVDMWSEPSPDEFK